MGFDDARTAEVLGRPGVLEDISRPSAYDSPEDTIEGWTRRIDSLVTHTDATIDRFVGSGPLITDDRPLPEYFLLRRLLNVDIP
jgi:hypothetical protein